MSLKDKINAAKAATKTEVKVAPKAEKVEKVAKEVKAEPKVAPKKEAPAKTPKEKKPAEPKEPAIRFKYPESAGFDPILDRIDEMLANDNKFISFTMAQELLAGEGKVAKDKEFAAIWSLVASFVLNGGEGVTKKELLEAYRNKDAKRAQKLDWEAVRALIEEGGYTADDILAVIPVSEDEAYYFALLIENGWNDMIGFKSINGKAAVALRPYLRKVLAEIRKA